MENDEKEEELKQKKSKDFSKTIEITANSDLYKPNLHNLNNNLISAPIASIFSPNNLENKLEKISIRRNNLKDQNINITKNNFEIINDKSNYNKEKDKILEKLLFENNALKDKIIDKENEIKQLTIDKNNYNGWDSSKYQQKIKELESKLKDNKNIKGQLNILKSQKTNLYKDFSKYKEISENLKKENEKLMKEKDDFKKQRDKLNNEIKILKINSANNTHANTNNNTTTNNISKGISKQKLLTIQTEKNYDKKKKKIEKRKKTEEKKPNTLNCAESESLSVTNTVSKDPSIITINTNTNNTNCININKINVITKITNFTFNGIKNKMEDKDNIVLTNISPKCNNYNKNIEMKKIISDKDVEIFSYKEKIESLEKELKEIKDSKKNEKPKSKKKQNIKKEESNARLINNTEKLNIKKYTDEIIELKNNVKKLENEKNSLKSKLENNEKKKNEQIQKQIEDYKKQINNYNNQIKALKSKNSEFEELFTIAKSFIKIIKPSNEKETDLYFKLKNHIDFLEKEKNIK